MKNSSLKIIAENAIVAMRNRTLNPIDQKELNKIIAKLDTLTEEEKAAVKLIAAQNKNYEILSKEIEQQLAALGELPQIDLTIEELQSLIEKIEKKRKRKAEELLEAKQTEAPVLD